MTSLRRDIVCSLILLAVAGVGYVAASRIGATALSDEVGPAGLPLIYAIALACVAAGLGVSTLLRHAFGRQSTAAADSTTVSRRVLRAAGTVAIGIGFLASVRFIGYPFAMALMIALMALYQGQRVSMRLFLVAAIGAVVLFVLFEYVLGVTLPAPWNP